MEPGFILGVVVLNVSIGILQEAKAEKAADALRKRCCRPLPVSRGYRTSLAWRRSTAMRGCARCVGFAAALFVLVEMDKVLGTHSLRHVLRPARAADVDGGRGERAVCGSGSCGARRLKHYHLRRLRDAHCGVVIIIVIWAVHLPQVRARFPADAEASIPHSREDIRQS